MKHVYEIADPIYNMPLTVYVGSRRQFDAYCEIRWGVERVDGVTPEGGEHGLIERGDKLLAMVLWLPHWNCTINEYAALVHEVSHHGLTVCERCGIPVTAGRGNEAYCYYVEMMFAAALNALCSEWKRGQGR